jgi:putative ABC transport system ATP-binding protein
MSPPPRPTGLAVLRQIVGGQRGRLAVATALFVSHQLGEIAVPVVAGALIDRAVVTGDGDALLRWLLVLAGVFAVLSTSWRWGDRLFTRAQEAAALDLRLAVTRRVAAPVGLAGVGPVGDVLRVAEADTAGATRVLGAVAASAAATAPLLVAAVVLLSFSLPLGLVVVIGLPPLLLVAQRLVAPIERRVAGQQRDLARAAAAATDVLAGIRVLKGLGAEDEAAARYRRASRQSLVAGLRATRLLAGHHGLTTATTGVFVALVALVGGRLAAGGSLAVGELVAAVGVTQFLVGPLNRLGFAASELATARASAARVAAVLEAPGLVGDGTAPLPARVSGALQLASISHASLADFDLDVAPGELLAVVAADPADATTLVDLLARRADPANGVLRVDAHPFPELRLDELRGAILVVDHDAPLFTGTVADNVGAADIHAANIHAALTASAADEVVATLPGGLDATLAERGCSLSGGQRQRLALARALALDAAVLVLHDPTTAVDAVTEARIADGLRTRRTGRTTVVVTSSPALLSVADRVAFVDGGRVADVGAHDELAARSPRYAEIVLA